MGLARHASSSSLRLAAVLAAALLATAPGSSAQTPSERCAAAQKEMAKRRDLELSQMSGWKCDTTQQVRLVPQQWAQTGEARSDSAEAVSTNLRYPVPYSIPVAFVSVRRVADFEIDLMRLDGSLIATYIFEGVHGGEYVFDLRRAENREAPSAQLQVRIGDRRIGEPQRVYIGPP